MATDTPLECALLITKNPMVRARLRFERGKAPLMCLDLISKASVYQRLYKDADTIFIDTALLLPGSSNAVEEVLISIRRDVTIIYLVTSMEELRRIGLTPHQRFKILNISSQTKPWQ